jgi:hypothetical protein
MKRLDIQITKATLTSFSVELEEGKPKVSATIGLLTEGGKPITTYSISTKTWNEEDQFDLPMECIGPILIIARQLEAVVVRHCRDSQKALSATVEGQDSESLTEVDEIEDVVINDIEDIDDKPIDLSEIPF